MDEPIVNDTFAMTLKETVNNLGTDILNQPAFYAHLADRMAGNFKNDTRLLLQLIKAGIHRIIMETGNSADTALRLDRELRNDYFINPEAARRMVCILFFVLREQTIDFSKMIYSSWNSQEEVEAAVSICDDCRMPIHSKQRYCSFCGRQLPLNVSFQEGTLEVPPCAFKKHKIKKIKLPESLQRIGESAFESCNITGTLEIPAAATVIEDKAFMDNKINHVIIHGVTSIGNSAFSNNEITKLTIKGIVTEIGNCAFYGKNRISSLVIPEGCVSIGNSAFCRNNIKTLTLPNSLTGIGHFTFYCNLIETLVLPDNLIKLGEGAFSSNNIESLVLPRSLAKIEKEAFRNNRIENLVLPGSLIEIGEKAFSYNQIKNLIINSKLNIIPEYCFSHNKLEKIIIPTSVNLILDYSFYGNEINELILPKNVKIKGNYPFYPDYQSIEDMEKMDHIYIPEGLKTFQDVYRKNKRKTCVIKKQREKDVTTWFYQPVNKQFTEENL